MRRLVLAVAFVAASALPASVADAPIPEILVSRQLADELGLSRGAVVQVADDVTGRTASFRVSGLYEVIPDPMRFTARRLEVRMHLPDLVDLTSDPSDPQAGEEVGAINVRLRDPEGVATFSRDLAARLPGVLVVPASGGRAADPFVVLERFHVAISVVTILGSTAFLLALMVMRAEERREIAGVLRLLGFRRNRILLQVLLEGLFVAAAGAVFGVLFALALEDVVNAFFQWRYDTSLVFVRVTREIAARCVAIAAPLGMLAGLVASWSLLRRDVVELVRR